MSIDFLRWLASLAIGFALIAWTVEGQKNAYQLAFGLAVYGALCYQHGWKLDYRRGVRARFISFYVLPFAIAATVIAIQILHRKMSWIQMPVSIKNTFVLPNDLRNHQEPRSSFR